MFKNVMAYRIGPNWNATVPEIETALSANRFTECTPGQDKSVGWTEPRNVSHGPLLESVGGQWIAKLLIETKVVPSSVVKRKAEIQAQDIEAQTGRKPGKKETREMREDILHSLLPQAFAKQGAVMVWINPKERLLAIDAGSAGKADAGNTEGEDKFDADVVLSTGMLGPLLKDVIDALGGENVFAESASGEEGSPF